MIQLARMWIARREPVVIPIMVHAFWIHPNVRVMAPHILILVMARFAFRTHALNLSALVVFKAIVYLVPVLLIAPTELRLLIAVIWVDLGRVLIQRAPRHVMISAPAHVAETPAALPHAALEQVKYAVDLKRNVAIEPALLLCVPTLVSVNSAVACQTLPLSVIPGNNVVCMMERHPVAARHLIPVIQAEVASK